MSEIVERVARALCKLTGRDPDNEVVVRYDTVVGYGPVKTVSTTKTIKAWELYNAQARAAIEAMRHPTDAMITAGYDEYSLSYSSEPGEGRDYDATPFAWNTMIDVALRDAFPTGEPT